jgi:hypothetical protein
VPLFGIGVLLAIPPIVLTLTADASGAHQLSALLVAFAIGAGLALEAGLAILVGRALAGT